MEEGLPGTVIVTTGGLSILEPREEIIRIEEKDSRRGSIGGSITTFSLNNPNRAVSSLA